MSRFVSFLHTVVVEIDDIHTCSEHPPEHQQGFSLICNILYMIVEYVAIYFFKMVKFISD